MMPTAEELDRMKKQDIRELDRDSLVDVADIRIDRSRPAHEKIRSFMEQAKNPYAQKVGDYILMVTYDEGSHDRLEDRLVLLAKSMTEIPL